MTIKTLFIALSVGTLFSCNSKTGKEKTEPAPAPQGKDTTVAAPETPATPQPLVLKALRLDGVTLLQKGMLRKGKLLTDDNKTSLDIEQLDKMPAPEFKYRLLDTLFSGPQCKVLLIGREYVNENKAWLAVYDAAGKMISQLDVYYDNAEGFLSVSSVIKDSSITVTTLNDFEENEKEKKKVKTYAIDNKGQLQVIH